MKIWQSAYQLYPKGLANSQTKTKFRRGTILRVRFEDDLVGYADLCPLSEMGDRPLDNELLALSRGKPEELGTRSLYFARQDAVARHERRSLYKNNIRIKNHFLILNLLSFDVDRLLMLEKSGFTEFKVKMGRELAAETLALEKISRMLKPTSRLRLDFNGSLSGERFVDWFEKNQNWLRPAVEFFEDPFEYNPELWAYTSEKYNIRLALDQLADPILTGALGADIVVLKPVKQDVREIVKALFATNKKFVITHYLDFPLGQMSAYFEAQELTATLGERLLVCGLQHHDVYEGFTFQSAIQQDGPYIRPPEGYGLGFDQLLDGLKWVDLK